MNKEEWQWKEDDYTVTRSVCWSPPGTHGGCGVLLYTKENKLVKVEGDPECPFNQGRLCAKTLSIRRFIEHPERLKYPMKRIGDKTENKWKKISWEEALDTIEKKFNEIKEEFGPESVLFMQGTGRDAIGLKRLAFAYGSPNYMSCGPASGMACYWPKLIFHPLTTGSILNVADMSQFFMERYDNPRWEIPKYILVWGNNPTVNCSDFFFGHWVTDCMKRGSKIIVIDPRCTWLASRASKWLQIRPGTDSALALGFLHVIIKEELYDKDFVQKWTFGFEQLVERVMEYPPERVSEITRIPMDLIIETARLYAKSKPSCIQWGVALDQTTECSDSTRAIIALMAITGNIDIPGGNVLVKHLFSEAFFWGIELMTRKMKKKKFGIKKYPLWDLVTSIQPDAWFEEMQKNPQVSKAAWIQGTNTFTGSFGDPQGVYELFKKLDFVVVLDMFMTPTISAFADIILPIAMFPERNGIKSLGWDRMQVLNKAVEPLGECKSDLEIDRLVGRRLNPEAWPWENEEEVLDALLKSSGISFKELREKLWIYKNMEYKKYEKDGFSTGSRKIELYLPIFEAYGYDPLPKYEEPTISPISTPELFKKYPLILTSGGRLPMFFHSEHRQFGGGLRELHPFPLVEIHPETARRYGITEGDWVWIENHHGRCKQKARLTKAIDPKVVHAQHSWWYPERSMKEPSLGGVWEANINQLLPSGLQGKCGFGYPFKVNLCRIYKEEI